MIINRYCNNLEKETDYFKKQTEDYNKLLNAMNALIESFDLELQYEEDTE